MGNKLLKNILVGFTNTYELGSTTLHFAVGKGHDQFYQFSENIYFAFEKITFLFSFYYLS